MKSKSRQFSWCACATMILLGLGGACGGGADDGEMTKNDAGVDTGGGLAPAMVVGASCTDGKFREELPGNASVDDLIATYSPEDATTFIEQAVDRRYPFGASNIRRGRRGLLGDCLGIYLKDRSSADAIFGSVSRTV